MAELMASGVTIAGDPAGFPTGSAFCLDPSRRRPLTMELERELSCFGKQVSG